MEVTLEESFLQGVTDAEILDLTGEIPSEKVHKLGINLGFALSKIEIYRAQNSINMLALDGTRNMLIDWRNDTPKKERRAKLRKAMEDAELTGLADQYFGDATKQGSKRKADQLVAGPSSPPKAKKHFVPPNSTQSNPKKTIHQKKKKIKKKKKKKDLEGNPGNAGMSSPRDKKTKEPVVLVEEGRHWKSMNTFRMAVLRQGDDKVRDLFIDDKMSELIKEAEKLEVKQQVVFTKVKKWGALNATPKTKIRPSKDGFKYDKSILNAYINPPVMSLKKAKKAPARSRMSIKGEISRVEPPKAKSLLTLNDGYEEVSVSLWKKDLAEELTVERGNKVHITAVKKNGSCFDSTPSTKIKVLGVTGTVTAIRWAKGENSTQPVIDSPSPDEGYHGKKEQEVLGEMDTNVIMNDGGNKKVSP